MSTSVTKARNAVRRFEELLRSARAALQAAEYNEARRELSKQRAKREKKRIWQHTVYWRFVRSGLRSIAAFARRNRSTSYVKLKKAIDSVMLERYAAHNDQVIARVWPENSCGGTPFDSDCDIMFVNLQKAILASINGKTDEWQERLLDQHSTATVRSVGLQ